MYKQLVDCQNVAAKFITGGMSSSFRKNAFTNIPMYVERADGARFTDLTGKEYIDFFMCHGAVLLGHNRPEVKEAIIESLRKGYFAGYDSEATIDFGRKVCKAVPAAESLRFVNSGTEGTLLALRLARGYTGKNKIVRIDGHFHGIHDYLLSNNLAEKVDYANDGTRPSKVIGRTAGIPDVVDQVMIIIPWNNLELIEKIFKEQGDEISGIIMNIIDYNNGCFLTTTDYLQGVRKLCNNYGVVLIFDEILSGFKTGLTCAHGYYGVTPDICILGKALTNGVPLGIVVGKKKIMDKIIDPIDPVISGGTFSGNQLGIAAGNAVLDILAASGFYEQFLSRVNTFYSELQQLFIDTEFHAVVQSLGAGFIINVGVTKPLQTYADIKKTNRQLTNRFFTACIDKGLYFHTDFTVSAAHDVNTLHEALQRVNDAIKQVRS
jgi:glutamate-1-semialdehyde 2,1-aminomutase